MNLISTLVVTSARPLSVSIANIQDSPDVSQLLMEILHDNHQQLKSTYVKLQLLISILQKKKGPKGFNKMQDLIFQFMKNYSYDRLRACQQQIVILNLTYYEKIVKQFLNSQKRLQVILIFIVANIHTFIRTLDPKRLNSVEDKLQQANCYSLQGYMQNVFALITAILSFLKKEHKRAKTLLANFFTKIITESKLSLTKQGDTQLMAIAAYYSYQNLTVLEQYELSYYYLTKSYDLGKKLGDSATFFLSKIKQIGEYKSYRVVKLTRIQNKIEVMNRNTKTSWHSKNMKSKIYSQKKVVDHNEANQQLKNLFTIKDTKATMYKFRKDNMRYLTKEQNKLTIDIKNKEDQLQQIQQMKKILDNRQQINTVSQNIERLNEKREDINVEYTQLKQKYFQKLPQVKKIAKYIHSFLTQINYSQQKQILFQKNQINQSTVQISFLNYKNEQLKV